MLASPPLCQSRKGCPKGTPENQKTLTPANLDCYMHYRQCRAVGSFPDDPLVRQNAEIIRTQEDLFETYLKNKAQADLTTMIVSLNCLTPQET